MLIKIIIAVDNTIIRYGLISILKSCNRNFSPVPFTENLLSSDNRLNINEFDILIICDSKYTSLRESIFESSGAMPIPNIILLSDHPNFNSISNYKNGKISGIISIGESKKSLISIITKIYNGKQMISNSNLSKFKNMIELKRKSDLLTKRELQIIKLIANGYSNQEAGQLLKISPKTIDTHRTNAMRKLNIHSISGIVRFAFEAGLLE